MSTEDQGVHVQVQGQQVHVNINVLGAAVVPPDGPPEPAEEPAVEEPPSPGRPPAAPSPHARAAAAAPDIAVDSVEHRRDLPRDVDAKIWRCAVLQDVGLRVSISDPAPQFVLDTGRRVAECNGLTGSARMARAFGLGRRCRVAITLSRYAAAGLFPPVALEIRCKFVVTLAMRSHEPVPLPQIHSPTEHARFVGHAAHVSMAFPSRTECLAFLSGAGVATEPSFC